MGLFDTTSFRIMEQGLAYTSANKKVIANNIANTDTPDYKSKYLTFSAVIREKLDEVGRKKDELNLRINDVVVDEITKGQPDGNNVDYELQSSMLTRNALQQESIINQIESEMRMMRAAMRRN